MPYKVEVEVGKMITDCLYSLANSYKTGHGLPHYILR